jgi:hypothetical protein
MWSHRLSQDPSPSGDPGDDGAEFVGNIQAIYGRVASLKSIVVWLRRLSTLVLYMGVLVGVVGRARAAVSIVQLPQDGDGCSNNEGATGPGTVNINTINTVASGDTLVVLMNIQSELVGIRNYPGNLNVYGSRCQVCMVARRPAIMRIFGTRVMCPATEPVMGSHCTRRPTTISPHHF